MLSKFAQEKIFRAEGALSSIDANISRLSASITAGEKMKETIEESQVLLQIVAKDTQESLRFHVEDIVQLALNYCFPGKYTFQMRFELKRGRTEAFLYLVDDVGNTVHPMDSTGGGVVDIIAFALRIAAWTLARTSNVIILDEPFKFLSAGIRPLAGGILRELSQKMGLQIILVTHDPALIEEADKIFEVYQENGVSKIK